jgi:hypothetical protein
MYGMKKKGEPKPPMPKPAPTKKPPVPKPAKKK